MTWRVLVVDDEWLILDFTRSILVDLGCEVITASAATEALQRIRTDDAIDLLITDIQMPGMNGAELVQRVKKMRPNLSVIVTSGCADPLFGVPMMRKPFSPKDLLEMIERHIGPC
jgi:CheY-like chemotaxis protein